MTTIYIDGTPKKIFSTRFARYGRLEVVVGTSVPESAHDLPEGWVNSEDKGISITTNGHHYSFRKPEEK